VKRALVTGGDGFVGQHLLPDLLGRSHVVTGSVLALPPKRVTITPGQTEAVDWKVADVTDAASLYRLVAAVQPDVVFHLAGFSSAVKARVEPEEALRVNAGGTINLLEALLSVRDDFPDLDPRIVVMSSGATYGGAAVGDCGLEESAALQPTSPYSVSKACQELVADSYRRSRGMRIVVARVFNLVGPGQREEFVVPSFCGQVAEIAAGRAQPVLKVGNLEVERDFLDVRDGVAALAELGQLPEPKMVYNVGSGGATRVQAVLDWILQEAGVQVELLADPERVREGEEKRLLANIDRIMEHSDWRPERRLEDTIRETYRWFADRIV
jgi:GDP-4-dehydro-6-deoxy-D-mannose reductase